MESKREVEPQQETQQDNGELFHGLTVGEVLGHSGCDLLRETETLADLAENLANSGRTAALVRGPDDNLSGLVTENDVLRAYFEGTWHSTLLGQWLQSGAARAPKAMLHRVMVAPSTPLAEAAEIMVENALAGDCACHHAIVREKDGRLLGILDSQDIIKAVCRPSSHKGNHPFHKTDPNGVPLDMGELTVQEVMKPRQLVFTCKPDETIKDVLRLLLVTHQNSTLICDKEGIHGIITPRDAVRAFADGVPHSNSTKWLLSKPPNAAHRTVAPTLHLVEAAARMVKEDVHHLVAVLPESNEAVGIVSSLDIVLHSRRAPAALPAAPPAPPTGPTVGDVLRKHPHLAAVCPRGTSLADVAKSFHRTGKTSTLVPLEGTTDGNTLGLFTENDLMRAHIGGWPCDASIEGWMTSAEAEHAELAPHLLVPVSMPLVKAAELMLTAASPQRTCHHLVATSDAGTWVGVFSALDIARALQDLCTGLDAAKAGADRAFVAAVMKKADDVPTVQPSDTLQDALTKLSVFEQNAALVVNAAGQHVGLVTTRCAIESCAEGTLLSRTVMDWVRSRPSSEGPREVRPYARLLEAAAIMSKYTLHHLIVVDSPRATVGVLSSLDLARGVASVETECPFVSLGWLKRCKGLRACQWHGN